MSPQICLAGTRAPEAWGTCSDLKGPAGHAPCVGLDPWDAFFLSLVSSRPHTSWRTSCLSAHLPASTVSYLIPLLRYLKARSFLFFFFFFQNIYLFICLQWVAAHGIVHCGAFSCLQHSGLVTLRHVRLWFPHQGVNLHPLPWKADS